MSQPTVTLAMIVKNEEENLDTCLRSVVGHVDELIIVDTGSRDRTREVAVRHGASVYQFDPRTNPEDFFVDDEATCRQFGAPGPYSGEVTLGHFGNARAESFRHAKGDFVLWVDADDVVLGAENIRGLAADLQQRGLDFGFLPYDYARDHMGRVFYHQWRERLVRRGTANWVNAVHEVLLPTKPILPQRYDTVRMSHRRKADRKTTPHRNYKLLLRDLWKLKTRDPGAAVDPRTFFYLGQEARFVEPARAVGFYEEYLKVSGWTDERAAAHCALGHIYEFGMVNIPEGERLQRANREYATAAAEVPENPDGLFGMARVAHARGRWADCVNYSERAFKIGNTDSMLGMNPMDRLYRPHAYYNYALANLGRLPEAVESCKAALTVCPDDPGVPGGASGMITLNLKVFEEAMRKGQEMPPAADAGRALVEFNRNEDLDAPPAGGIPKDALAIWAIQLWKQCLAAGEPARALNLLEALEPVLGDDPLLGRMREATRCKAAIVNLPHLDNLPGVLPGGHPPTSGKQSVAFWVGPSFEPWDPTTPATRGIGGSETACIEMAKHLAALGHKVTVFGDLRHLGHSPAAKAFDGVDYVHYEHFRGVDCDVFISSRVPHILQHAHLIRAKLKLLWVHDIHVGARSAELERLLLRFDRVLCLSEWHKGFFLQTYPTVHPDQVIVTRNGIEPSRFSKVVPKKNKLVFSSSPNRGLPLLLRNFRLIRAQVPNAELHVYYGFDCWETLARQRDATAELEEIARYKAEIANAAREGGVVWHGRVPQQELADAFMEAKVWPYLTAFPETSCITAMEAQAAGCVPVASRYAALAETVKHGVLIDIGDASNPRPNAAGEWLAHVVRLLKDEHARAPLAAQGRAWALEHLSWSALARDWSVMFDSLGVAVAANPLPLWRSA